MTFLRLRRAEILVFGIAALVFALDQWTKSLVLKHLPFQQPWNPIDALRPFVTLTHVHNTGAAFGIFPSGGLFFTVISIVVVIAILFYYRQFPSNQPFVRISLGLQMGGALGNLFDRLTLGYVVDFIDFQIWPVFNVADMAIVAGVIILAYFLLFRAEDVVSQEAEPEPS